MVLVEVVRCKQIYYYIKAIINIYSKFITFQELKKSQCGLCHIILSILCVGCCYYTYGENEAHRGLGNKS